MGNDGRCRCRRAYIPGTHLVHNRDSATATSGGEAEPDCRNANSGIEIVVGRTRKLGEPLLLSFQSVRNVGNGPAFNINLSPIKKPPFEVTFSSIAILEPKENATLDFTIYQDAITSGMAKMTVWLESVIETGQLGSEMAVGISYADASGKRYRSNHVVRFDIASKAVTTEFKSHQELVE